MNDDVIDGSSVDVVALQATGTSIPDLYSSVLRAGDHPFPFAVECDSRDVACVTFEGHHRVGVSGLDVEELDIIVTRSGKESLIRGDAQAIDLRVRVLNGS